MPDSGQTDIFHNHIHDINIGINKIFGASLKEIFKNCITITSD